MGDSKKPPIVFPHASYTTIAKETQHPIAGHVKGKIPEWLTGNFFRLGPGKFEVRNQSFDHWFDGFAIVHRYKIKNGAVTYDHKIIESEGYKKSKECGQLMNVGFGTVTYPDPCKSLLRRFISYFEIPTTDNCNVNLMVIGKEMFALTESYTIQKINDVTLDTLESIDVRKHVPVLTQTAHPHTATDGTVYNIGTSVDYKIRYNILQIPPPNMKGSEDLNRTSILCSIACPGINPCYYHSFGITQNYIVFVEQPLTINAFKALTFRLLGNAMDSCLDYDPSGNTYIHLVRRDTGEHLKTRFFAKAFFTLHHINAFEQDGHVVVDMCCYDNIDVLYSFRIKNMKTGFIPKTDNKPMRYVLPVESMQSDGFSGSVGKQLVTLEGSRAKAYVREHSVYLEPEQISELSVELPKINYESHNGKRYRYFYGLGYGLQTLVKIDIKSKSSLSWSEADWFPSEPVFVESPDAKAEDDGVILSSVIHLKSEKSPFLLILNARTFAEVARVEIPADVIYGMHGLFLPD